MSALQQWRFQAGMTAQTPYRTAKATKAPASTPDEIFSLAP